MQRLTPDILHIRIVQIVSDKREAQIFHMDTDLVGASGLQDEGDEAVSVFLFHNAVMGYSPFALIEIDLTLDEGAARPANRSVYRAGSRSDMAADNSKVFPADFMARGHCGQDAGAYHVFCDYGEPGCITVKAVCTPEDKGLIFFFFLIHQCIGK